MSEHPQLRYAPLTENQKRWLLNLKGWGKVEGRLGRNRFLWNSLEKRGLVKMEIIGGSMSLTTLEFNPTWDKYRITLTEAGEEKAAEIEAWVKAGRPNE